MADPISLTLMGIGTALGAVSSIGSAQSQAAQLQAQANAQNYNAALYNQQAEQTMAQANEQANVQQRRAKAAMATQRAATAESGLGFAGTGGDLINQSAISAELDRQNILYNGILNAQGLQSQAEQSTYAAQVAQSNITPTVAGGYLSAGGNILSGFAYGMDKYRGLTKAQYPTEVTASAAANIGGGGLTPSMLRTTPWSMM